MRRLLLPPKPVDPCAFPGCGRPAKACTLCGAHIKQASLGSLYPIGSSRSFRRHRQPIDCPICGAPTYARASIPGVQRLRDCSGGHRIVFSADGSKFVRLAQRTAPDPRPCDFQGCGRPRQGRFCKSHQKQRQRNGLEGMRPLNEARSESIKRSRR